MMMKAVSLALVFVSGGACFTAAAAEATSTAQAKLTIREPYKLKVSVDNNDLVISSAAEADVNLWSFTVEQQGAPCKIGFHSPDMATDGSAAMVVKASDGKAAFNVVPGADMTDFKWVSGNKRWETASAIDKAKKVKFSTKADNVKEWIVGSYTLTVEALSAES